MDRILPHRALAHPLWVGALLLLILNDHLFKGAGILPGWLTGKVSDVSGLLVAPLLLAVLVGARSRGRLRWAHLAVGGGFALINVWPAAARGLEWLTAEMGVPWSVVADPTDLLALAVLPLSWRVFARAAGAGAVVHPVGWRLALGVGLLACMGTSPPDGGEVFPSIYGDLMIGNDTSELQIVRVRPLRSGVTLRCDVVAADPSGTLSRELFAPAVVWLVDPGRAIPVRQNVSNFAQDPDVCHAFLVDGGQLSMRLLFWRAGDFEVGQQATTVDGTQGGQTLLLTKDAGAATLAPHVALFAPPPSVDPPAPLGCEVPGEASGVDWSLPLPLGKALLLDLEATPDGCWALDLQGQVDLQRWFLCVPGVQLPFVVGDEVAVTTRNFGQQVAAIDGLEIIGDDARLRVGRGPDIVQFAPSGTAKSVPAECGAHHDACGGLMQLTEVRISSESIGGTIALQAGDSVKLADGTGELTVVRSMDTPVLDTACLPGGSGGPYVESAFVSWPASAEGEGE